MEINIMIGMVNSFHIIRKGTIIWYLKGGIYWKSHIHGVTMMTKFA